MPVIAIINRKGGSGKSTLAAHIAAWCAHRGSAVMLGDVDRQQSSRAWLRRREAHLPAIAPWAVDEAKGLRLPAGVTHVVLDTPGGLHGFELARVVMFADAILMPVCSSMFDRESAAACHAELMALPRVASGRCRVATLGMRIDGRTQAAQQLREWSEGLGLPFLGALREAQVYVRSLERGMTIFDLPPSQAAIDLAQWEPLKAWLEPVLYAPQAANDAGPQASVAPRAMVVPAAPRAPVLPAVGLGRSRPASLMPAQESLVHGGRLTGTRPAPITVQPVRVVAPPRLGDKPEIPHFLRRGV
ncbi:MAG: ParA family protein [Burkholderiaceae bacterium]